MLDFTFSKGFKLSFDFTFFAVLALFLCFDTTGYGVMSIVSCALHEFGHLMAMLFEHKKPHQIRFYGGGVQICTNDRQHSLFVITAGVATNFFVFLLSYFFADGTSIYPLIFATMNLLTACFNLLPIGHLDGYKLLEIVLMKRFSAERALEVLDFVERLCFGILTCVGILLIVCSVVNFTLVILIFYLIIANVVQTK